MGEAELFDLLASGYAVCRSSAIDNSATLFSLFLAGLAGSASHCIGMCGPIVLTQVSARLEAVPASSMNEFSRLRGAALAPYHLGRMTTYAGLGAAAAGLSGGIIQTSGFKYLATGLLILAGGFFLSYGMRTLGLPGFGAPSTGASSTRGSWANIPGKLARPLFSYPLGWRGYLLGILLGFIPCGLLYGALAAAASTADPVAGFLAMGVFAIATMPVLLVVGFSGHIIIGRLRRLTAWISPILLLVNGGFLLILAFKTGL